MIQYFLWAITFIFLWLTLFWLNYLYTTPPTKNKTQQPHVTIAIPAWNEQNTITKTLNSLSQLTYPNAQVFTVGLNVGF